VAVQTHAFIEQNPQTKMYRLGNGFLHLARIREATFPIGKVTQPVLERLAQETGETAHSSLISGNSLVTVGVCPSSRATRVHVDFDELLPMHATASGLVCLAFASEGPLEDVLAAPLQRFASGTICDVDELRATVTATRERGFGLAHQSYEDEVVGIAAPIFDPDGKPYGAVSVASPTSRTDDGRVEANSKLVIAAALEVTRSMGGAVGESFLKANAGRIA